LLAAQQISTPIPHPTVAQASGTHHGCAVPSATIATANATPMNAAARPQAIQVTNTHRLNHVLRSTCGRSQTVRSSSAITTECTTGERRAAVRRSLLASRTIVTVPDVWGADDPYEGDESTMLAEAKASASTVLIFVLALAVVAFGGLALVAWALSQVHIPFGLRADF
jgi:hypothetical protein